MRCKKWIPVLLVAGLVLYPCTEAKAEENVVSSDSGIAGITWILNEYYNHGDANQDLYFDGVKLKAVHRTPSQYEYVGIANVNNYVNIRSGPSTRYDVVGKLYDGCVANIIAREGDWVKIQSGNVKTGYIHVDYLLSGWDAEEKMAEVCESIATVNCSVLNVRAGMGTDYKICGQVSRGEMYPVAEVSEEWVKLVLGQDERTGQEITGYVFKKYVDVEYQFQ